jgi:DNA-binding response OmpR family regulator
MTGKHVLILEDDLSTQSLLRKQLEAEGYEVSAAADGLEGLMRLEVKQPDLILVDLAMPKLGGMEFVKAIKSVDETRRIPVIFLTANNDPAAVIDGINVGARFYLTKPFQMTELLLKIRRVLTTPRQ